MNNEFRQMAIEILQRDEELPSEWAHIFFPPEKREYELVYYGKERGEDILADTMAVPLQPVSTFGKNSDDWHNKLIFGDNLQVMKTLLKMKEKGELVNADGTPGVRLIYIDPPFATKKEFLGSKEQRAYQDKIIGAEFVEFLRQRLIIMSKLLTPDGFICVHLDYRKKHYIKIIMDEIFGENSFRNEIIVNRVKKSNHEREKVRKLNEEFDTILLYAKSEGAQLLPPTKVAKKGPRWHGFDAPNFRTGMDYSLFGRKPNSNRHWSWEESRARVAVNNYVRYEKERIDDETIEEYSQRIGTDIDSMEFIRAKPSTGTPEYFIPASDSVLCNNVWNDISAYSFSNAYPTEKSEALLSRIIGMITNSRDIVLDAFAGSGTTCAVAEKLGRRWISIDCGKLSIYTIQKRLLNLKLEIGNKGKHINAKPFTLYNAGLYDFSTLKQLPWADWRFFALQLFGCKDEPHEIGGLRLDGKLRRASVMVFNHRENPGKRIDEETIEDIHNAVGKLIGNRFFIVAPRGVFDFQQDYIDLEGIRYYALRIPYSIINELHQREFSALQQPNDATSVNETVNAVGFDFIQPPKVEWSLSIVKRENCDEACLRIKSFKSRARLRGKDTQGEWETFSMLMLDYDYNGKIFDMDAVADAHQMQKNDWQVFFPLERLGVNIMVNFIDIYGNEAREMITRNTFSPAATQSKPVKKKKTRS